MKINDSVLQTQEKIIFALRELYSEYNYLPYRMSKFEEYDLYANNKDFLLSDNVITFNDTDGKLMALKPDVTLSIIKNTCDEPDKIKRVYYNENVYRVSKGIGSFKEIMQTGIECFGKVENNEIFEVLLLAANSLKILSENYVLAVSDLGVVTSLIEELDLDSDEKTAVYKAVGEKNTDELKAMFSDNKNDEKINLLIKLIKLHGTVNELLPDLKSLLSDEYSDFITILELLSRNEISSHIYIDFSVVSDINYYNGIVFKGFIRDIPVEVLSGGQYNNLMKKMGRNSSAIGFAVYTDVFDSFDKSVSSNIKEYDTYLNIALPKGRLGEKIYDLFAKAGYECPSLLEPNRKLIFENSEKKIRYFWVKPSDVAIYVERGAADIGVAGKDILLEYEPDVYELADLKKGKCRMCVAAKKDFCDDANKTLRVATKFTQVAKSFYRAKGRNIDIIHLNGSIEIAPILNLSDVIVDIVETGTTLKENNLEVIDTVFPISARLISNKASYKFKSDQIRNLTECLEKITED